MKKNTLYIIALVFTLYGCAITPLPALQKLKDEYHHSSLHIPHIFLIDVETASANNFPESHWDNTDSITKMFVNELNNLDITIELNDSIINNWSDSVWTKKPKDYYYLPYRRLNINYILGTVTYSEKPQLIPLIIYRHVHRTDPGGRRHRVIIDLWTFIVENGELVYSKSASKGTKSIFYVYKHKLDKSEVDTKYIWERVVEDAMSDYLKNLKEKE